MKFKEWREWYKSLHGSQKWFIIFILIRPLVDNFYYFKNISPLISPLYIVGVLTPVLCIHSIRMVKNYYRSPIDTIFGIWFAMVLFSSLFVFLNNPFDLKSYEWLFQTTIVYFIFFFARRLVKSPRDIDGILQTFLYSACIVAGFILYEILFHPLKSIQTRGMERLEGLYADVMNYGIYITQSILIGCFFMLRKNISLTKKYRMYLLIFILILGIISLLRIVHASSIGVSITIILLFSLFYFQRNIFQALLFIGIGTVALMSFGSDIFEERILPLISADIEVYSGEREEGQAFHGRMSRWERMWGDFSEQPVTSQFFGVPLSIKEPYKYITAGTHNDYLRVIFLSGFIGLVVYLLFLFNIFLRIKNLTAPYKFLLLGAWLTMVLYSISTAPNLYAPLIYVVYSVYAFVLLPEKVVRTSA